MKKILALALALSATTPALFGQTTSYDFGSLYVAPSDTTTPTTTPFTLDGATFTSPSDPGAFTVGINGFSSLVPDDTYILSDAGTPATLTIDFTTPQSAVSFFYQSGDFLEFNTDDTLTVTTNTGETVNDTSAQLVGTDFFPSGEFNHTFSAPFSSLTISDSDSSGAEDIAELGELTTSVPEPSTWAMVFLAGGVLLYLRRRLNNA